MGEPWDHVFGLSKFSSGFAMLLSTVALTTIVSATFRHVSDDTDRPGTALPRKLREWNLSDSRSAAAATGWAKGKYSKFHTYILFDITMHFVQAVILACLGMMFSAL